MTLITAYPKHHAPVTFDLDPEDHDVTAENVVDMIDMIVKVLEEDDDEDTE